MLNMPQGWVSVKLGDIANIAYGKGLPTKDLTLKGFPVFGANGVIGFFDEYLFEAPQLLISCRGANSGTINFSPSQCFVTNNSLIVDFPVEQTQLRKTLFYFLMVANKERLVTGTAQPQVTINNAVELALCLPPLAEQHRIVAKIEELFSELDHGVASLKTAREQLKVYRQSLLKNAFEGKLTAAWRAAHRDQLETATALQQRIARERQARYQQQLADWQTQGGPKPKTPKPLPPISVEELADLPELPEGWGWMKLGSLASQITDGEHFRPPTTEQGVPFLSAKDVRADGVSFSDPLFIDLEAAEKAWGRCRPERNDILIVSRGATVGRMCAVNTDQSFCLLGSVILIKGISALRPAYLLAALKAPFTNKKIVGVSGATAQQAIYLRDIQNVPVAICSLSEQFEIVQELDSKLSEADQLDQTLATALQQADALRQSILKKAFCGQLVPQDQNEEPATALLERILAERLSGPAKKKTRSTAGATR